MPLKDKTELATIDQLRASAKLDHSIQFERKLGAAAYNDGRSLEAASQMIGKITQAMIPQFDEHDAAHQQQYAQLYGKDAQRGAGSAGQVGNEFQTVMTALNQGNLRERMTGIYNASLGEFKAEVLRLMSESRWQEMKDRGFDDKKLKRRKNQRRFNPAARDLYRDPGNPADRKNELVSLSALRGQTRTAAPPEERQSKRTVGELDNLGAPLSEREKQFMYPDHYQGGDADLLFAVEPDEQLTWNEGGTWWQMNQDNKWVRKVQDKLHMPVAAGPSGTALRMFQAWEFVGRPAIKESFRLALLGWMMTSNDHTFHEIMMTSAEYGMPYTPGPLAYRNVLPFTPDQLRAIANPEGFPDEQHYQMDHAQFGGQNSALASPAQIVEFENILAGGHDLWAAGRPPAGIELAQALAVLIYTDEADQAGDHAGAYKFINNALKGNDNKITMWWFMQQEPRLKAAYARNKFNLRELIGEAKDHARLMQDGLKLLKPFKGRVYRGYRTNTLPRLGESWTDSKFLSMSKNRRIAEGFASKGSGKYRVLVEVFSNDGRDLGQLSQMGPNEQEVLFPPGAQFQVISPPQQDPDRPDFYTCDLGNG